MVTHSRKRCWIGIRIGGANIHGILLGNLANTYRLDEKIS
jgi:hypothetical protein